MSISEKKQKLGSGRTREKPGKTPPPKKEKKDTSVFGGKPDMEASDFIHFIKKDPSLYSKTNLSSARREKLGGKLFGSYGSRIDREEIEKTKRELALGKWGKFKDFSQKEREDAERLIRELEK
jgi:hypothetical protein